MTMTSAPLVVVAFTLLLAEGSTEFCSRMERAVRLAKQQTVFVAFRERVIIDRACAGNKTAGARRKSKTAQFELAVGRRERVGFQGVHVGIAHHQIDERIAFELALRFISWVRAK